MTRKNKLIYWVATIWLALGTTVTGIGQIIKMENGAGGSGSITQLGYPLYLLSIIGVLKLLGVVAVLMPKAPLVKEWAYAGFVFLMTGALYSHIANHDEVKQVFGPALLLILTLLSWHFRPDNKRITAQNENRHVVNKRLSALAESEIE